MSNIGLEYSVPSIVTKFTLLFPKNLLDVIHACRVSNLFIIKSLKTVSYKAAIDESKLIITYVILGQGPIIDTKLVYRSAIFL